MAGNEAHLWLCQAPLGVLRRPHAQYIWRRLKNHFQPGFSPADIHMIAGIVRLDECTRVRAIEGDRTPGSGRVRFTFRGRWLDILSEVTIVLGIPPAVDILRNVCV